MREVKEILKLEVKRIHQAAQEGRLSLEDLRALESLTKSWKNYFGHEIDEAKDLLTDVSKEELLKVLDNE